MNSISRSAFAALDPVARISHVRGGGTVINDPPVAKPGGDMPFILDGAERLRWIESKRTWDAETDRMKAVEAEAERAEFLAWKASH